MTSVGGSQIDDLDGKPSAQCFNHLLDGCRSRSDRAEGIFDDKRYRPLGICVDPGVCATAGRRDRIIA
jgi:hypothetical protein